MSDIHKVLTSGLPMSASSLPSNTDDYSKKNDLTSHSRMNFQGIF